MSKIIYAIKIADLSFSGLKVLHVKIGQTSNIKRTLAQYRRGNPEVGMLDLWKPNPLKTVSECEKGIHEIAERYAYERKGENFIFLQEGYKEFSENVNLLLKNIPKDEIERRKETRTKSQKKIDYTGKKPKIIKFQGKTYKVNSWIGVLHLIAKKIHQDKRNFSPALGIRGTKRNYFSKKSENLVNPKKIKGTSYFFEANISSNRAMRIVNQLLNTFEYDESYLEIIYR